MRSLAMLTMSAVVLVSHASAQSPDDQERLQSLVQKAAQAWAAGDGEAYAALFAAEADYVTFGGMRLKGPSEIARVHQQLFDGPLVGSHLRLKIQSIRFLSPNIAVLHVEGGIVEAGQDQLSPGRNSMQTLVATRSDKDWRITSCQVTRIDPIGAPPRGR